MLDSYYSNNIYWPKWSWAEMVIGPNQHNRRADKNPYLHDRRADKNPYRHDRFADSQCQRV